MQWSSGKISARRSPSELHLGRWVVARKRAIPARMYIEARLPGFKGQKDCSVWVFVCRPLFQKVNERGGEICQELDWERTEWSGGEGGVSSQTWEVESVENKRKKSNDWEWSPKGVRRARDKDTIHGLAYGKQGVLHLCALHWRTITQSSVCKIYLYCNWPCIL